LYISGAGVGRGYLNCPELTRERFTRGSFEKPPLDPTKLLFNHSPITNHQSPIYKTGDRARWMPAGGASGGVIQFLGRADDQVKIRGYRVELSEIQKQLLEYKTITDAVVVVRHSPNDPRDKFVCAYIVTANDSNMPGLKRFLAEKLPAYMIPAYFIPIEKIPLTPNGKLDKKSLPLPEIKAGDNYVAPRNQLEKKLVNIWANVLGINEDIISIDANFFQLGGHSLKATSLIALVHRQLNVKIPITEVFKYPTIRSLANVLNKAPGEAFTAIEPVEKKEYYELSPAQERFYFIQQTNIESTAYNMPGFFILNENPGRNKFEQVFASLLARHESLRTSFEIVNERPVQKIVYSPAFQLEYNEEIGKNSEEVIRSFIRPFDLAKAPLLRVGLVKVEATKYLLMIDMHHIISDVISLAVLIDDFISIYQGKQLPSLKVQYKDYCGWVRREQDREPMARQERYWLNQFTGNIQVLDLPTDYPRGPEKTFAGDTIHFNLPTDMDRELMKMALAEGVSMFMLVLALFNILLSKLSGREEIIIGTLMAGRRHKDLDPVIGLFTNTIALKNDAAGNKTFKEFLAGVGQSTLEAYENQDYPFLNLVNKLPIGKSKNRNPLFDILFFLDNLFQRSTGKMAEEMPNLKIKPYDYKRDISKMDLTLTGVEMQDGLSFRIEYSTQLFKKETIERFIDYFKDIVQQVCADINIRLGDIHIAHGLLAAESVSTADNDEGFRF
jgi:acyl carrier protein